MNYELVSYNLDELKDLDSKFPSFFAEHHLTNTELEGGAVGGNNDAAGAEANPSRLFLVLLVLSYFEMYNLRIKYGYFFKKS